MKTLLIVESPAKSKTIEKLLGPDYIVKASFGHIRDLDSGDKNNSYGIEINNNFRPIYKQLPKSSKHIQELKDAASKVDRVLLASDEDREGEAIAWHLAIVLKLGLNNENRICFHEITEPALRHAVSNPRRIDVNMVNSQQARRILDRLVGFEISPLLWRNISVGLSAGRVQSVCLKLIVNKETEIRNMNERKYYRTVGYFKENIVGVLNPVFEEESLLTNFLERMKTVEFTVENLDTKRVEKRPPPPYTTSSIQQDLGSRLHYSAKMIMSILQHLYESGKITYHRTDSTLLSDHIMKEIKDYVSNDPELGRDYFCKRIYKTKAKSAQEAHEAIRPTSIFTLNLDDTFEETNKLVYQMIWRRTVASQMAPCISDVFTMTIGMGPQHPEKFIAKAERIVSEGYKKIYNDDIKKEGEEEDEVVGSLFGDVKVGDKLERDKIVGTEKYQNPPPRYSEASIIKKMEVAGIGRPSTYASILDTLFERKYIEKKNIKGTKKEGKCWTLEDNRIKNHKIDITIGGEKQKLVPSDLGIRTDAYLNTNFNTVINEEFTSQMEDKLDRIAAGELVWNQVVGECYNTFHPIVESELAKSSSKTGTLSKKLLGDDNGKNIYVYQARYGPVYQIGEDNDKTKRYIPINEGKTLDTVTFEDYLELKAGGLLPQKIGTYENGDIVLKKGKFGFYITHKNKNYSVSEELGLDITLPDAINIINPPQQTVTNATTNTNDFPKRVGIYMIRNGKFGPYVQLDSIFASIPKNQDPFSLTEEECKVLIDKKKNTIPATNVLTNNNTTETTEKTTKKSTTTKKTTKK